MTLPDFTDTKLAVIVQESTPFRRNFYTEIYSIYHTKLLKLDVCELHVLGTGQEVTTTPGRRVIRGGAKHFLIHRPEYERKSSRFQGV